MKETIPVADKAATMTSIQIAEVTNKRHTNVLRAIRSMEPAWEKVNGLKFELVEYIDSKGERRPCYSLTKTECLYIATKFNDEARARLILRWEQLENEKVLPAETLRVVEQLNQALETSRETIERLKRTIDDKSRAIAELERMASLLDPDHKAFTSSADFQFVTDCMLRLCRLELIKAERVGNLELRVAALEKGGAL